MRYRSILQESVLPRLQAHKEALLGLLKTKTSLMVSSARTKVKGKPCCDDCGNKVKSKSKVKPKSRVKPKSKVKPK